MLKKLSLTALLCVSGITSAVEFEAGSSGGGGGSPFSDNPPSDFSHIANITLCGGSKIDSILVNYEDLSGNTYSFGKHGGNGGSCETLYFWSGEYIRSISGKHGSAVDSLSITTNQGRVLKKGGSGGYATFKYTASDQFKISGFKGRSGSRLDAVGVIYSQDY